MAALNYGHHPNVSQFAVHNFSKQLQMNERPHDEMREKREEHAQRSHNNGHEGDIVLLYAVKAIAIRISQFANVFCFFFRKTHTRRRRRCCVEM